jgi:hypothetical protein
MKQNKPQDRRDQSGRNQNAPESKGNNRTEEDASQRAADRKDSSTARNTHDQRELESRRGRGAFKGYQGL